MVTGPVTAAAFITVLIKLIVKRSVICVLAYHISHLHSVNVRNDKYYEDVFLQGEGKEKYVSGIILPSLLFLRVNSKNIVGFSILYFPSLKIFHH